MELELRASIKVEQQEPNSTILDLSRQEALRSETEEPDPNNYVPIPHQAKPQAAADKRIVKRSPSPTIAVQVERDHKSSSPSRPAKRRKVEVVLPRLADIKKLEKARDRVDLEKLEAMKNLDEVAYVPLAAVEELDAAAQVFNKDFRVEMLKSMKNPKVKKKKDIELTLDTIWNRLIPIGGLKLFDITLPKVNLDVMVTRQFLSSTYGGNPQRMCPKPSKKFLDVHGMNDWMYLNPDYQHVAPQVPGAPGLCFDSEEADEDFDGMKRVFTRIQSGFWQYMGTYEIKRSTPPALTMAEWRDQPRKVRSTWAREICNQGWGQSVRTRILGRKLYGDRRITVEELDKVKSMTDALNKITRDEVFRAYDEGVERLGVYTMKCVGYDNAFQLELCEKFASYVPPPKPPKPDNATKPSSQKRKKAQNSPKTQGKKQKRKSSERDHDLDDQDGEREESDDYEGVEWKMYKNRGTRSRPGVL
ncbi:hypothetical protein CPC08DRAFT_667608 [Agrocybe pediades]|nr:hypothetical protein CPC08DRAFT_667608 [Agrocybe pediades]